MGSTSSASAGSRQRPSGGGEGAQEHAVAVEREGRGGLQGREVGRTHAALEFARTPGDGEAEDEDREEGF